MRGDISANEGISRDLRSLKLYTRAVLQDALTKVFGGKISLQMFSMYQVINGRITMGPMIKGVLNDHDYIRDVNRVFVEVGKPDLLDNSD